MLRLLLLAAALASAPGPYPSQHAGTGREPTAGTGTFAGTTFTPRSALVRYELGASCCPQKTVGELTVYLFERAGVTCSGLEAAKSRRFVSYEVETDGRALPVGKPPPSSWFQQASFNVPGLTTGFQIGISIVFTRIDTSARGVWHGRIVAPRAKLSGKTYAFTGTFAGGWCGTSRS